jgi:hypothetical protein
MQPSVLPERMAPLPVFEVTHSTGQSEIGGYEVAYGVTIKNIAAPARDLVGCWLKLNEMTGNPKRLRLPLVLRTDEQVRSNTRGAWPLFSTASESFPIVFRDALRKNEWFFFDQQGRRYHKPARSMQMLLGVHARGGLSATFLVRLRVKTGTPVTPLTSWLVDASIRRVRDDYVLKRVPDVTGIKTPPDDVLELPHDAAPGPRAVAARLRGAPPKWSAPDVYSAIRKHVFEEIDHHGLPTIGDPEWSKQGDVEESALRFCRANWDDEPSEGWMRREVRDWIAEFRQTTQG